MRLRHVFLLLSLLGVALPMWPFLPWIVEHGLDLPRMVRELFSTRIGAFFGLDVIVSAFVLSLFAVIEGRRQGVRFWWLAIVSTLLVGVSFGLPLFLYLRQSTLDSRA